MSKNEQKSDEIGKFLQLVVITTKEGVSYEFFGTPVYGSNDVPGIESIVFGPLIEKEGAIEYLRSGSKYLFEGMEGEGAWVIERGDGTTDHGSKY